MIPLSRQERFRRVRRSIFRVRAYALAAALVALLASGWLRPAALPWGHLIPLVGLGLCIFLILIMVLPFPRYILHGALAVLLLLHWVARVGRPAIPHLPAPVGAYVSPLATEALGIVLCLAGVLLIGLSVRKGERCFLLLISSGLLLLVEVGSAFMYDSLTRSPYITVRQYAWAVYRGDERALRELMTPGALALYTDDVYPLPSLSWWAPSSSNRGRLKPYFAGPAIAWDLRLWGLWVYESQATVQVTVSNVGYLFLERRSGDWKLAVYPGWGQKDANPGAETPQANLNSTGNLSHKR